MLESTSFGDLAYCLKQLDIRDLRLASAKEGMLDRIERFNANPNDKTHFDSGAWFSENFNRVNKRILGARAEFNPLIPYIEQVAYKGYLPLSEEVRIKSKPALQLLNEIAEKDAIKPLWERRVIDLGKVKTYNVPTDSFADDDTIVWLAQSKELARDYGLFLRKPEIDIKEVNVYNAESEGKDSAFGFWMYGLNKYFWSSFDGGGARFWCCHENLYYENGRAFGLPLKISEVS